MTDTIAAIATGGARSAIGILRLSGDRAIDIVNQMFHVKHCTVFDAEPRKLLYGELRDEKGRLLDLCLCTVSRAPHSFTGEDTAELQCHGSPVVLASALRAAIALGARQAEPGEFTKRAFLNGRLDLTGCEAIIDLIDAETEDAARNAAGQLSGAVAKKTDEIYSKLLDMASHFHAVVDWPDEDIEDFRLADYLAALEGAKDELSALLATFERGRVLREGVRTAIVGRPNVGKSSLLNALLGFERAIVTDIPGTTRDTVEEKCVVGGVLLRLIDTAGLRETEDAVERLGVERTKRAIEDAGLVLFLADSSVRFTDEEAELVQTAAKRAPTLLVWTKGDLPAAPAPYIAWETPPAAALTVSAVTGEGLRELADAVKALFPTPPVPQGELLTNARQAAEVRSAVGSLDAAISAMEGGMTPDAVLVTIEDAMRALGAITGRSVGEDVVERIFERFCVGK